LGNFQVFLWDFRQSQVAQDIYPWRKDAFGKVSPMTQKKEWILQAERGVGTPTDLQILDILWWWFQILFIFIPTWGNDPI